MDSPKRETHAATQCFVLCQQPNAFLATVPRPLTVGLFDATIMVWSNTTPMTDAATSTILVFGSNYGPLAMGTCWLLREISPRTEVA